VQVARDVEQVARIARAEARLKEMVRHEVCWIDDTTCPECNAEGVV